jgi:hypothetical protein
MLADKEGLTDETAFDKAFFRRVMRRELNLCVPSPDLFVTILRADT